jgi:diacylglycerol kinase family enzyme
MALGTTLSHPKVWQGRAKRVEMEIAPSGAYIVHTDGELSVLPPMRVSKLSATVHPGRLRVLAGCDFSG